jgi:hypothetical protein
MVFFDLAAVRAFTMLRLAALTCFCVAMQPHLQ